MLKVSRILRAVAATADMPPPALIQFLKEQTHSADHWYKVVGGAALESAYGLAPQVLKHIIEKESRGDPFAVSPRGAKGVFQIMPKAQSGFMGNPFDPIASAHFVAQTLAKFLKRFNGDYEKALVAYNWGQGNLAKKGLSQAPLETRNYIKYFKSKGIIPNGPLTWGEDDFKDPTGSWGENGY